MKECLKIIDADKLENQNSSTRILMELENIMKQLIRIQKQNKIQEFIKDIIIALINLKR